MNAVVTIKSALVVAGIAVVGALGAVLTPQSVSAQAAGPGGGGGSSGCSSFNYSTCFGAVWRYYRTTTDPYTIRSVSGPNTVVRGCSATGGFFAYVLVNKNAPNDGNQVRSWKIGNQNGQNNSSIFFGGYTNYRVFSRPTDPIPTNPASGQYSWYSVQKAFAQTKALGQNSGFEWNRQSQLGWFCYRGSDFNLTTNITANTQAAEPGSSVTLSPSIANSGGSASSNAQWQVTQRVVPQGQSIPGAGASSSAPTTYYGSGSTTIRNGTGVFQRGTTSLTAFGSVVPDIPVTSRVCYALSVQPRSNASSDWYHGAPFCIVIAKLPKIQVLGGDVIVGSSNEPGNIVTTFGRKTVSGQERSFGSWGEYGVIASGSIVGMASGAGYSGGAPGNFCSVSLLTVTNAGESICTDVTAKGSYTTPQSLPNITDRFVSTSSIDLGATADIDVADANRVSGIYRVSESLTMRNTGTVPVGKWLVINAPGADVTIADNLVYTNQPLSRPADIPQVIIIADRIAIESDVSRVDAWLVATGETGSINTCSEITNPAQSGSPLTANRCTERLTVNGPVIAKQLFLYRTAGSGTGTASGDPAEVFNLRPDAYLWAAYYNSTAGRVPTVNTRELPPRF